MSPPFAIHAVARAARSFTGDFYLYDRREDGVWLGLGDVAGKGLDAAVVMAMTQEVVDRELEAGADSGRLGSLVEQVHGEIGRELPGNRFVSLVLAHLDAAGRLELVNAGHCPPLVRRRDGTIEEIGPTGPVVAPLPGLRWTSTSRRLEAGDVLLLYSDGLLEAESPAGAELGVSGIARSLRSAPPSPADALVTGLLGSVASFRGSSEAHDDSTVLALVFGEPPVHGELPRAPSFPATLAG